MLLYPADTDGSDPELFLRYLASDYPRRTYAGFADDAYLSQDGYHTNMLGNQWANAFDDSSGNLAPPWTDGTHTRLVTPPVAGGNIAPLGATYTSQSTTGMGHDVANTTSYGWTEQSWYFMNALRAGPAYISYKDDTSRRVIDEFQALTPAYYDSMGASGSELWALNKLAIAELIFGYRVCNGTAGTVRDGA